MMAGSAAERAERKQWRASWGTWRGLIGLLALAVALIGAQASPALADDTEWTHRYPTSDQPYFFARKIAADATGAYVLGTDQYGIGVPAPLRVEKLDSHDNVAWTTRSDQGPQHSFGGIAAADGAVYVTYADRPANPGPNDPWQAYLWKLDAQAGAGQWLIPLGPLNGTPSVTADASGVYLIGATLAPDGSTQDIFIRHYGTGGSELWTRSLGTPYGGEISAAGGVLYATFSLAGQPPALRKYDASGTELWTRSIPFDGHLAADPSGVSISGYSVPDGKPTLVRHDAAGTVAWSHQFTGGDARLIAAGGNRIYAAGLNSSAGAPSSTVETFDLTGAEVPIQTIQLTVNEMAAGGGGAYVLQQPGNSGPDNDAVVGKLRGSGLRGQITWSDAYPERVGQGVPGATVTAGGQSVTTDAQGNYELPPELEGQQATVELPLFDLAGSQASAASARTAQAPSTAAAGRVTAKVADSLTLTIDPSSGTVKPTATFGKNVSMTALGQTVTLTNVRLTDQGLETVGGTTQLSFKYDPNSPPLTLNATISYVKASNQLTITGTSGTQFQWGGQTATLDSFEFKSPQNTVTMAASLTLSLSRVTIAAQLTGTGTADGVTLQARGQAEIQGITVFFDPITVENGQFHVKGHVKLPNQPIELAFDTLTGFDAPRLILPLPQFQWDGQVIPLRLELLGSAMILAGEGSVQLGGQAVNLSVDTRFNAPSASVSTVHMNATIPLPDGEATASLKYDPSKPQNSSVTGTLKVFLALCPGRKTDFNVDVRASSSTISLGFHTQVPIDCDGNGSSTLVDLDGSFNGQLAQLKASWPVTAGSVNGRASATVKSDGTYVEIMFNAELKFGPGGSRSSSAQTASGPNSRAAAATDVRVLLTDGVGRRTGFDPATGQIVNEIPGGRYDGIVNGMDTFTMPGRVGGYAITLYSQTSQQVQVAVTVNGQTTLQTAQVGPGPGVTLAAEVVPQNGGVSVQVGVVQVGCAPRPPVRITPVPGGGALQATFTAAPGSSIAANAIREIRIGQAQNGVVDGAGQTGLAAGAVIAFPTPVSSTTLTVRRVTPGQATTVPLVIVDGCGEWRTFVGGGPTAF